MKKTLAIALVLVMVVSCMSVLFVSAEEVESLTVEFTQLEGTSTNDCSLTLHPGEAEEKELKSGDVNIRWAYAMAIDADGTIVRLGKNLLSEAQDTNNGFDHHGILIPAGGNAIVFHCGDGENTKGNEELRVYFVDLLTAAGYGDTDCDNTVLDVSAAGWQIANLTTEGGEYDYGSVTLYKGAAPAGEGDKPEEPKEPEIVTETIAVDGELNDTGWTKAEWLDKGFWQGVQEGEYPGDDITGKYAVRADEEKIYIALEMNTIEPNTTAAYNAEGDFTQSAASNIRIWIKKDVDSRTFFDLQYNGEEFKLGQWKSNHDASGDNLEYKVVYADGKVIAEIAVSIEDLGIEDSFYLLVTYSETFETGYNAIHFTTAETLNDPAGGDNAAYWAEKNTYSYTEYTVEDLLLGTYTVEDEPTVPDDTYEDDIAALVGADRESADFAIDLESAIEDGVMTVTLTVKDIKEGVLMHALMAHLYYDTERLELTNKINKDMSVECATALPYGDDSEWENLTKVSKDEEGMIDISFVVAVDPDQYIDADHPIVLTFTFKVLEGFDKAGVYIPTASVTSKFVGENTESSKDYVGNGAYTVATTKTAPAPDDSSSTPSEGTSSGTTKPGDAGILVFAILGILAVAGAATVIKVRH